jgi:hypothetical protein
MILAQSRVLRLFQRIENEGHGRAVSRSFPQMTEVLHGRGRARHSPPHRADFSDPVALLRACATSRFRRPRSAPRPCLAPVVC